MMLGQGGCDVLQALYDGSVDGNIYTGWRDFQADKSAYLLMYLSEGITVLNACNDLSN